LGVIILVPAMVAVWYIVQRSYREAFLYVYLPTVLCLPGWCRWILPGLPDPTFHEAAILPIAAAYFLKGKERWKFSAMDAQVAGLLFLMGFSEMQNAGFADAQNLMFDMVAAGLFPYVLAKGIVEPGGLRVCFAKVFVWSLAVVFILTLYEARFAFNPYRMIFAPFFPGQSAEWVTTFRYGLPRVAGPFGHAILAGVVFLIGLQLQLWLKNGGYWEERFKVSLPFNVRKPLVFTVTTLGGLILTLVRGPQIGALVAWIITYLGRGRDPRRRYLIGLCSLAAIGIPLFLWFLSYASVGRAEATSSSQETAAYRKELIDKYLQIALDHAGLGWGRNGWPKVPGMPSIDNHYLLLSLMHGFVATGLLVSIFIALIWRLYLNGVRNAERRDNGSSLSFSLMGMFAGIAFSIATVYMGDSLIPVFFLMVGFAEGYLVAGGDSILGNALDAGTFLESKPFHFKRIVT
jgi:hypothetical protein